jgi:protein SCO1/2
MNTRVIILSLCGATVLAVLSALAINRQTLAIQARATRQRTFEVRGVVRGVDAASGTVRIQHEEIPGYMPAMTMPLTVRDRALLDGLTAGAVVRFTLAVTATDSWIARLDRIAGEPADAGSNETTESVSARDAQRLQAGETVPDFTLLDQENKPFRIRDFRGKAVVLTFIYTRCPLPNFCPAMSKNFAALQERLEKEFPGRYRLLSVSIDPGFDRPEVLKHYAARYDAKEGAWTFATGTAEQVDAVAAMMGLTYEPQNGMIAHDLRTALIGPDGRLVQVWKSNVWTPYEVQRRVRETLTGKRYPGGR